MKRKSLHLLGAALIFTVFLAGCSGEKEEPVVIDYFAPGEYIVVNINDSYRLLMTTPVLVLSKALTDESSDGTATLGDELTLMQPKIRETINEVVRQKDEASLRSAGIMDQLRGEIVQALNERLAMDYVTDVQFSDFVIQ